MRSALDPMRSGIPPFGNVSMAIAKAVVIVNDHFAAKIILVNRYELIVIIIPCIRKPLM